MSNSGSKRRITESGSGISLACAANTVRPGSAASQPGVWYAGTSPQGLFRSDDDGVTWQSASPINDDPQYIAWMGTVQDGTPDGPKLHSIIVDPRDPAHLLFGMSGGGVHESHDAGRSWH